MKSVSNKVNEKANETAPKKTMDPTKDISPKKETDQNYKTIFKKTKGLTDKPFHYCPGCTHGIIHRLVAETLEELNIIEKTIGVAPVGCSVFAYDYFNCDMHEAAHGRAPAVATGIKRVHPDNIGFTYQGDGDLASIGTAEIVHAAARSENITVIYVNNAIFGMTGGQMAPTTLIGQKTTTTPLGRDALLNGYPINMAEMLAQLIGTTYVERVSVSNVKNIRRAKQAIKRAFENQINKKGFSMIEILSTCPTNWGMSPLDAMKWIDTEMTEVFPLDIFKEVE